MDNLTNTWPVAKVIEQLTDWLTVHFSGLFNLLQTVGQKVMDTITGILGLVPIPVWIVLLTVIAYIITNKKKGLPIFTFLGLVFIANQGLWDALLQTTTLVLVASVISIVIGVPLGILMAKSETVRKVLTPILDFMQSMPSFVYLIPAVAFFGIGMVPGVFASVIFALPPTVRFTHLGIKQIPTELVEASDSFGGTAWQKLLKLELPLAKKTILAGVNQTTMLALSMVVTASMIGAPGLGRNVLAALQKADIGSGFVSGLALVILAIMIDRFIQYTNREKQHAHQKMPKKQKIALTSAVLAVLAIGAIVQNVVLGTQTKETIRLAYVQWDTEVASTNVIAQVLEDEGYQVEMTPLDNAVMWEAVANKRADAMVAAWLPNTHASQYKKYKDQLVDLGANLKGAKVGLVVPSYMKVDAISDLSDEAGKKITGIEPGAGVVSGAKKTLKAYDNLSDWQVETSSSGAMVVALDKAIKNKEDIVITGWSPHWMFAKYDLKYLKDDKQSMGSAEEIHTMTSKDFAKEHQKANQILDNFHWSTKDMESVMLAIQNGKEPKQAAKDWIKDNPEKVKAWVKTK